MAKAWKGFADDLEDRPLVDCGPKDSGYDHPVLVIDASEFPDGYPLLKTKWSYYGKKVTVISNPWPDSAGNWFVKTRRENGVTDSALIVQLEPIPKQATGEVVGTLTIDADGGQWQNVTEMGTYDIIRRDP